MNIYNYANQNSLRLFDEYGQCPFCVAAGAAAAIAIARKIIIRMVKYACKNIRCRAGLDTKGDHNFRWVAWLKGEKKCWMKHAQVDCWNRKSKSKKPFFTIRIPYGKCCKLKYCKDQL